MNFSSKYSILYKFFSFLFFVGILAPAAIMLTTESMAEEKEGENIALLPHKALYDIKLISKHSGTQILNISGQMYYEVQNACDSWISNHRFKLLYEYADSPSIQMNSDFSTVESLDGQTFDFTSRRKRNGELYEEFRGKALISSDNLNQSIVNYTVPENLSFDLSGAYFPMKHTQHLLKSAKQGQSFFSAKVFDGSDGEGPAEINAFIGKRINVVATMETNPDIDITLLNTPAWKIRMAFFPLTKQNTISEYEMEVSFHENGIVSDMIVEYEDFSISQKLLALEKLEPDDCNEKN